MTDDPDALFPPVQRRDAVSSLRSVAAGPRHCPTLLPHWRHAPTGRPPDEFHEEPPDWVDPVLAGEDLVEEVKASADEPGLHIWWLGQSGFLVSVEGETILFDPYLSDWLTENGDGTGTPHERITGLVVEPSLLSFVDVVTSSHAHLDHLDAGTLPGVLSGNAAFVCAAGSEDIAAERAGRQPDAALHVGEYASFADFWLEAVPAHHDGAPEAVGYIVRNGMHTVYHAGDSRGAGNGRGSRAVRRRCRVRPDQRPARQHGRGRCRPARV